MLGGGLGWGAVWLPRIGHEVIVSFIEGDPDRPIIIGSVYNGSNTPPYTLPDDKTKSTVKSESSLGGGGSNEIRFEDKKGEEEVFIHAQKDHNIVVENNRSATITANDSVGVGGNRSLSVSGNETIEVTGSCTRTIHGGETLLVEQGRDVAVTSGETQTIRGGRAVTIEGGDERLTAGANRIEEVTSNYNLTVHANLVVEVDANHDDHATGNRSATADGDVVLGALGGGDIHLSSLSGMARVNGGSSIEITSNGDININSSTGIVLRSGGSTIFISPTGIAIDSSGIISITGSLIQNNC
jgi:type VI secretion system secreted protein VgrG